MCDETIVRRRRKNNKKSLIVITESDYIDSITENKKTFGLDEYQSVGFAVLDKNMEGQKSKWMVYCGISGYCHRLCIKTVDG